MENQNIKYKDVPLIKEIEKFNDNILYYGEGGIGKTTQMQLAFNYFSSKCTNTVPVFLDADEEIDFRKADPLMSAIACKYLGSDIETDDIWKLFTNNSPSSAKNYTYIIFVDGINELTQNNKGYLIEKITHIIDESKNTRFIISSRIKENLGLRFKNIAIKPLEKKNILKYLGENYGVNDNSKNINDSLVEILQIPLYLSVFKNTYKGSDYKPNIYDESTVRKADILDSYIQKLLHEKRKTNAADTVLFEFIVKYFLPALAFEMVKENMFSIDYDSADRFCESTKYFKGIAKRKFVDFNINSADTICVSNCALLEAHNDVYTFPHQIWRDYFCAKHIINCLNVAYSDQIQNDLEVPVDNEIRGFVGQLIYTYDEKFHYSKEEHFPPEKSDRMCECDFEAKDNLEDWDESPIEHYLQQHNLKQEEQNQVSPLVTCNLIEIMKNSRNNKITAKYNSLDFQKTILYKTHLKNSTFTNSILYEDTLFIPDDYNPDFITCFPNCDKIVCEKRCIKKDFVIWDVRSKKIKKRIYRCIAAKTLKTKNSVNLFYINDKFEFHQYDMIKETDIHLFIKDINDDTNDIAVSLNKKHLAISNNNFIRLFTLYESNYNEHITINAKFISLLEFSPDSKYLIGTEKYSDLIHIWDIETGIEINHLYTRQDYTIINLFFINNKEVVIQSNLNLCIWNLQDKTKMLKIDTCASYSNITYAYSCNKKLFCNITKSTIQIWNLENKKIIKEFKFNTNIISAIAFSLDNKYIGYGSDEGNVYIKNIIDDTDSDFIKHWKAHNEKICAISFSPNSKQILTSSYDHSMCIWNCTSGEESKTLLSDYNSNKYIATNIGNNNIAIISSGKIYGIWNMISQKFSKKHIAIEKHDYIFSCSNNGKKIAFCNKFGNKVYIYDILSGHLMFEKYSLLNQNLTAVYNKPILTTIVSMTWFDDDKKIICINDDQTLFGWDFTNNKLFVNIKKKEFKNTTAIASSKDGTYLACGNSAGQINIFNNNDGVLKLKLSFYGHKQRINSLSFSTKENKLVSCSDDRTIKIWDPNSGRQIGDTLKENKSAVKIVKFSKNDKFVYSMEIDNIIRIYNSENKKQLYTITTDTININSLDDVQFGNDICLITGNSDNTIQIWNLTSKMQQTINRMLDINISNCKFNNTEFDLDNSQKIKLYNTLYDNGAYLPEKYKPKEIPFLMNIINDDENKCFEC